MALYVLDASAMIAYLRAEAGGWVVREKLEDSGNVLTAHAINICEVYYDALRAYDQTRAEGSIAKLRSDGVNISRDIDDLFWMDIGSLKVNPGRLSIADCCAIALARRRLAMLLTADHHEMDRLVGTGTVDIEFIR